MGSDPFLSFWTILSTKVSIVVKDLFMADFKYMLTSQRLGFRKLEDSDLPNLIRLDTDPEVRAFFPGGVSTPDELREKITRSRESFEKKGYGEFSVSELGSDEFLGRAGFAELLRTLLDWAGKTLPLPRILAFAPVDHGASLGVMKKAGMKYLKTEAAHTETADGVECTFYEYPLKAGDAQAESRC
jgi:RimJ/RimL family protein N-acetyltransferase